MTGRELVSIIVQNGLLDKQIECGTELVFNVCMKEGVNPDEGNTYVDYGIDCDTGTHGYDIILPFSI